MQVRHLLIVLLVVGGLVEFRDCGEERTWDLGQWMEVAPVDAGRCDVG
jgi:hypothetical protein